MMELVLSPASAENLELSETGLPAFKRGVSQNMIASRVSPSSRKALRVSPAARKALRVSPAARKALRVSPAPRNFCFPTFAFPVHSASIFSQSSSDKKWRVPRRWERTFTSDGIFS